MHLHSCAREKGWRKVRWEEGGRKGIVLCVPLFPFLPMACMSSFASPSIKAWEPSSRKRKEEAAHTLQALLRSLSISLLTPCFLPSTLRGTQAAAWQAFPSSLKILTGTIIFWVHSN